MSVTQRLIWLTPSCGVQHKSKAEALQKLGWHVFFLQTIGEYATFQKRRRCNVILISDLMAFQQLVAMEEFRSARFILILEQGTTKAISVAAGQNFRDCIPLTLDTARWVKRIQMASFSKEAPYYPPLGEVTENYRAKLDIPARVTWVSDSHIRVESYLMPSVHAIVTLSGPFADALGVEAIRITVEKLETQNLNYRFSSAFVGRWRCDDGKTAFISERLQHFSQGKAFAQYRIFAVIKDEELRSRLYNFCKAPEYQLLSPLTIEQMGSEPKYYSPSVVFLETHFFLEKYEQKLQEMIQTLDAKTPIFIVGKSDNLLPPFLKTRVLIHLESMERKNIQEKILPFLYQDAEDKTGFWLEVNSTTSFATLSCPARITKIHPEVLAFSTPFPVRKYALCSLSSPLLKKVMLEEVWLKIVDTYPAKELHDTAFQWGSVGISLINKEPILAQLLDIQLRVHWGKYLGPSPAMVDTASLPEVVEPKPHWVFTVDKQKVVYTLIFLLVNIGILYLLVVFVPEWAKNREKSGKNFSEQLLRYQDKKGSP